MNNNFNISNVKNYNQNLQFKIKKYVLSYNELINEFLLYVVENLVVQNNEYFLFLIKRGIDTISHCFKMLITYTKNLELSMFHCKKAICYYIEFIGQINDVSIHHSYLQLNSKDATLFVYKKTIYDLDNNYRKTFELTNNEKKMLLDISESITLFNNLIITLLEKESINYIKKEAIIHYTIENTFKILNKILDTEDNFKQKVHICIFFFEIIKQYTINTVKYVKICNIFIKKVNKDFQSSNKLLTILNDNLYNPNCFSNIQELTALRFVNWVTHCQ